MVDCRRLHFASHQCVFCVYVFYVFEYFHFVVITAQLIPDKTRLLPVMCRVLR